MKKSKILRLLSLFVGMSVYTVLDCLGPDMKLYREFDKKINELHREILNLDDQKDQILLSENYDSSAKRVEVEKIVDEVDNLRYDTERITKKMQKLNVPDNFGKSAEEYVE